MSSIVKVVFPDGQEYECIAHPLPTREAANAWLDEQWQALECEPTHPMGKVLMLDKILSIARYGGAARFAAGQAWVQHYADAVATVLERPVLRVDVANRVVG
jgi:hypothetical protein